SFDVAAEEMFSAWLSGAAVVLRSTELPAHRLNDFIAAHSLTVVNLPAPFWHEWTSELIRDATPPPTCLRLVIAGSDTVLPEQLLAWQRLVGRQVRWCNAYGLTETT